MRSLFTLLLLVCLGSTLSAQTIRRCNNNPGVTGPNIYTSIQAAHDASSNDDIIYIESSGTSYGTLNCAKRLTIYGKGYFLENSPIGATDQVPPSIGNVSFGSGSSNTLFSGMYIIGAITFGTSVSAITVERSYIRDGVTFTSTCSGAASQFARNCTIKQCFINFNGIGGTCGTLENNANGIAILNCILRQTSYYHISNLNNALIANSIIAGGMRYLINSTVTNSIIKQNIDNNTATTFTNNINSFTNLPAGNGNINGANWSSLFETGDPQTDINFRLAAGSIAQGSGTGGTDIGAFGGSNPYIVSGQPPIPIITNLASDPSGNNGSPLKVKISIRSNN
ncbi:hypothetical protein GCM10028807_05700 [Spirosoma daeguense]